MAAMAAMGPCMEGEALGLIKLPSEQVYSALSGAMDEACARETDALRAAGGMSHEKSAVLSCVLDDLKANVMRCVDRASARTQASKRASERAHVCACARVALLCACLPLRVRACVSLSVSEIAR